MPITQDNARSILLLLGDWHRAHIERSQQTDGLKENGSGSKTGEEDGACCSPDKGLSLCLAACQKLGEYINFNFVEGEATPPSSLWGTEAVDMELHAVFLRKGEADGEELGLSFGNIPIFGDPEARKKGVQRRRRDQGPVIDVGCIWVTEVRKRSPACSCGRIKLRDEVLSVNGQLMVGVDVSGASYLADQCWNGGCIYLILLRRVKKKAPPPPSDVSIPLNSISCEDLNQDPNQNPHQNQHQDLHLDPNQDLHQNQHQDLHLDPNQDLHQNQHQDPHQNQHQDPHQNQHQDLHQNQHQDLHLDPNQDLHQNQHEYLHQDPCQDIHQDQHQDPHPSLIEDLHWDLQRGKQQDPNQNQQALHHGSDASEVSNTSANCKRTRKFGVISRSSFHRDQQDGSDPELLDCVASTEKSNFPTQLSAARSHNGVAATLPAKSCRQLSECRMSSFVSEPSGQHREGSYIWKMHMVKGQEGLGIHITGGRGSKRCPQGIIIARIEEGGAIHRDGRLHAGDELLMVNGQSLVGLTHQEAVAILRSTSGLVQLVVSSSEESDVDFKHFPSTSLPDISSTCRSSSSLSLASPASFFQPPSSCSAVENQRTAESLEKLDKHSEDDLKKWKCSPPPMKLCSQSQGGRLESVGEDDELFMDGGGVEVAAKPLAGRRKHSLPQQLDAAGVRQDYPLIKKAARSLSTVQVESPWRLAQPSIISTIVLMKGRGKGMRSWR